MTELQLGYVELLNDLLKQGHAEAALVVAEKLKKTTDKPVPAPSENKNKEITPITGAPSS